MKKLFIIIAESIKLFIKHDCLNMAAAIAFYAIFSMLPLLFLVFYFIGIILGTNLELFEQVMKIIILSVPYLSSNIFENFQGLIANRKSFGWIGMVMIIWSAEFVILGIRDAMNHIFGCPKKAGFIKTRIIVWGVFLIWNIIMLISIGITAAAGIFERVQITSLGFAHGITFKYFLPFILMFIIVTFVFKVTTGVNISLKYALLGSGIFSVLWEVAKHIFTWYIAVNVGSFSNIYGSFSAVLLLLLWIFYSASIFLFSAEIVASARRLKTQK